LQNDDGDVIVYEEDTAISPF